MVDFQSKKEHYSLRCFGCKATYDIDDYGKFYRCTKCGNLLEVKRDSDFSSNGLKSNRIGIWKYIDLIPLWDDKNIVSLSEGNTTLVECRNLASLFGIKSLYV